MINCQKTIKGTNKQTVSTCCDYGCLDTEGQGRLRGGSVVGGRPAPMGVAPSRNRLDNSVCQHTPTQTSLDREVGG